MPLGFPSGRARVSPILSGSCGAKIASAAVAVASLADDVQVLLALLRRKRPEFLAGMLRAGIAGKTVNAGDKWRRYASPSYRDPATIAVRVVFGYVPCDGGNVVLRPNVQPGSCCQEGFVIPFAQPPPVMGQTTSLYFESFLLRRCHRPKRRYRVSPGRTDRSDCHRRRRDKRRLAC